MPESKFLETFQFKDQFADKMKRACKVCWFYYQVVKDIRRKTDSFRVLQDDKSINKCWSTWHCNKLKIIIGQYQVWPYHQISYRDFKQLVEYFHQYLCNKRFPPGPFVFWWAITVKDYFELFFCPFCFVVKLFAIYF